MHTKLVTNLTILSFPFHYAPTPDLMFAFCSQTVFQEVSQKLQRSYPFVIGGSLGFILEIVVHGLPGHRQAVEMGHLQWSHFLHLRSHPFLHALVRQRSGDRKRV